MFRVRWATSSIKIVCFPSVNAEDSFLSYQSPLKSPLHAYTSKCFPCSFLQQFSLSWVLQYGLWYTLIFVHSEWCGSNFILLYVEIQFSNCLFSNICSWHLFQKLDGCTRHFGCRSQRIWAGTGLKASSWEPALILPESTMPTAKGGKQSAVLPTRDASEQHNQRPLKVQWWHFYLGSNQYIGIHTDGQQVQRRQGPSTEYGRETCRRSYLQWYLPVKRKSVQAWH